MTEDRVMRASAAPELVFDIETIPDQRPGVKDEIAATIAPPGNISKAETLAAWEAEKRPALIEEKWRKTALDGGRGHVAVIGWALDDDQVRTTWDNDYVGYERATLIEFFDEVTESLRKRTAEGNSRRPLVIGHNHTGFDIRFIWKRCWVLGVQPPPWFPHFNFKPWDEHLFDTMLAWAGRDYVRMDDICSALGIATKGSELEGEDGEDIDGSMVWQYVSEGKIEIVARYCCGDVERTREMYRRMTFRKVDKA